MFAFVMLFALLLTVCPIFVAESAQMDIALSVGADESEINIAWHSTSAKTGQVLLWHGAEAICFDSVATKANDGDFYSHEATLTGLWLREIWQRDLFSCGACDIVNILFG